MMEMMQTCWNWMMSFGVFGAILGIVVFVLLMTLLAILIWRLPSR